MKDDQIPSLPLTVQIDKQGKLVLAYGKYGCKFKTIGAKNVYPGILVTKFLWDVTNELWNAEMQRQGTIKDVKKALTGIDDTAADNLVRKIHEDLFGNAS